MTDETSYKPPPLRVPGVLEPKTVLGRFLLYGHRLDAPRQLREQEWYKVLWLTGVDYFSSLAYQPGIALVAAGALAPLATIWLVGVTLFGAVPIYTQIASRSFAGQGSIALLEDVFEGWRGKLLVLMLLGFACTGFLLTITISAADAAVHATANPYFRSFLRDGELFVTMVFFVPLIVVFFVGFRKAVGWAIAIAIPYVLANVLVLGTCLYEIAIHPHLLDEWTLSLDLAGDSQAILIATVLVFPKLALGLSGFETSLSVMPQVIGRVTATRKLLITAAAMMSVFLLASSFASTLLLRPEEYAPGGAAAGRVLSHLAHRLIGSGFGVAYDLLTMAILWFAAASAMVGLLNFIPRYLPRFGMAPHWASYRRPLVLVIIAACALVTLGLGADVEAQAPTYATGVLALIHASGVAVAISLYRQWHEANELKKRTIYFIRFLYMCLVCLLFTYALVDIIIDDPRGVFGALAIALAILMLGALSRTWRSTELRVSDITFTDEQSAELWKAMIGKKVHASPLRTSSREARRDKAEEIRKYYWADGPLAFLHVNLVDNRSDFIAPLSITVRKEDDNYVVEVFGAVAIANTIAYISELLDPISLFLGLTQQNLMSQSIKYVLWGEGETGLMVYMILLRYWRWTTGEEDVRPNIFLMTI